MAEIPSREEMSRVIRERGSAEDVRQIVEFQRTLRIGAVECVTRHFG